MPHPDRAGGRSRTAPGGFRFRVTPSAGPGGAPVRQPA